MDEKQRYDMICEKLGFRLENYQFPHFDTEDDSWESPFRKLTIEERDFLTDYAIAHDIWRIEE